MSSDRSTLSTAEVDAVLTATSTSRLINGKNQVNYLGNVKTPTLNMFRAAGKAMSTPVRGAYKCHMSSQRGQKLQSISGRDIHTFKSVDTLFDIEFSVGRVHLGDEWVHQQLEEGGINIDHAAASQPMMIDTGKAGWWTKGADVFEMLVNLADNKLQSLEINYTQEINKTFWRSNITDAKLWPGIDSALPRSSNTTGAIGNRSRAANPLLRHQLKVTSNGLDLERDLDDLRYLANKRINDGSRTNYCVCGRTYYNKIKEVFFGSRLAVDTVNRTPNIVRNYEQARSEGQAMAQKLGIGFPDDGIYLAGVGLLAVEPVFEDLDREDSPSILWEKSAFVFNTDHIMFKPTKGKDGAKKIHATPYNQFVTRISCYGEYALVLDWIDCHGATYLSA